MTTGGRETATVAARAGLAGRPSTGAPPSRPESFLEVRVAPGRVDVTEFYSDGEVRRFRELLKTLGLETEEEFTSPCG